MLLLCAASPTPSLTQTEFSISLKEFVRAQKTQVQALKHRYKSELDELKASQDIRQKEWRQLENDARHKFFEEHTKGTERRTYMHDFIRRRDAFHKLLVEERVRRMKEQEVHINQIRSDQSLKFNAFRNSLEKGEHPAVGLWPASGE